MTYTAVLPSDVDVVPAQFFFEWERPETTVSEVEKQSTSPHLVVLSELSVGVILVASSSFQFFIFPHGEDAYAGPASQFEPGPTLPML